MGFDVLVEGVTAAAACGRDGCVDWSHSPLLASDAPVGSAPRPAPALYDTQSPVSRSLALPLHEFFSRSVAGGKSLGSPVRGGSVRGRKSIIVPVSPGAATSPTSLLSPPVPPPLLLSVEVYDTNALTRDVYLVAVGCVDAAPWVRRSPLS